MKHSTKYSLLCGALLALCQSTSWAADEPKPATPAAPPSREKAALVTVTASVEDINYTNREVTLKGPKGNTITLAVDPAVKRLNEVKIGDLIRAEYYASIAAELRPPTAEEEEHPLTVTEAAGKAPAGVPPAVAGARQIKAVTTIEEIDQTAHTVTVKGPRGNVVTARVENPSNLAKMHVGEHIVITYTEALALSLVKVEPGTAPAE